MLKKIKKIKNINQSLQAKVFYLTAAMLFFISFLIYGLLAWLTPRTYTDRLNDALDAKARDFIARLEHSSKKDSAGLFDQFLASAEVSHIELYDSGGSSVDFPLANTAIAQDCVAVAIEDSSENTYVDESAYTRSPIVANSYYFSFANDSAVYMLNVYGVAGQITQLQQTFRQLLPLLCFLIFFTALSMALLYARMITKPVIRISRIAKKMTDLQLEWQIENPRSDELGILEKSLNTLSRKLASTIANLQSTNQMLASTLSDLQKANQKLNEDIEHERAMEQVRLNFFSAVSHELKTPVTIIKGQLEGMLLGIGVYKDHEKYLARALAVANTMEILVQEILTVSRLETSPSHRTTEYFDCIPIIHSYLAETEDWMIKKRLTPHCEIPSTAHIHGNPMLMEKVFTNLIGNAIKYSPENAEIYISLRPESGKFIFSVENTGVYIPEEYLSKLFDAFYRIDQSRNRKTGGSGLGLYIVQKILEQHGSRCIVANTERGVQFSFTV